MNVGRNFCAVVSLWLPRLAQKSSAYSRSLRERLRWHAAVMRDDAFEQALLAQAEARELVVDDRIDGNGGLRQPVGQCLLRVVELREAGRLQLDEAGIADALDQRRLRRRRPLGDERRRAQGEGQNRSRGLVVSSFDGSHCCGHVRALVRARRGRVVSGPGGAAGGGVPPV